ncbi:MAG: protein translocase SEC61 complex subunit gamma [Candidatus Micrarchaeota archaeon]|nr:protein translocase SEC61 complex subunit gamma [Candidatus Micrarchaeota archaeon]
MSIIKGLKEFYDKAVYVWRASEKPSQKEINTNLRIVLLGILVLGVIGFIISIIFGFLHFSQ